MVDCDTPVVAEPVDDSNESSHEDEDDEINQDEVEQVRNTKNLFPCLRNMLLYVEVRFTKIARAP